MRSLLTAITSWSDFITQYLGGEGASQAEKNTAALMGQAFNVISIVLWVILAIVGAVGAVYAIYLGVQLARAEDQGKRDDAKKHLITVCIAIGVTIALIVIFNVVVPMICGAFIKKKDGTTVNPDQTGGVLLPVLNVLKAFR